MYHHCCKYDELMKSLCFGKLHRLNVCIIFFIFLLLYNLLSLFCHARVLPVQYNIEIPLCTTLPFRSCRHTSLGLSGAIGEDTPSVGCFIRSLFYKPNIIWQPILNWPYCLRIFCRASYIAKGNVKRYFLFHNENLRMVISLI